MKHISTTAIMKTLFALIILAISTGCNKDEINSNDERSIDLDEKSEQLVEADNAFGLEVFQEIRAASDDANIMISPLSISVALAMAYNGAEGDTKAEMGETLKLKGLSVEEINTSYENLIDALQSLDKDVVFEIANSIFFEESFPVKQEFFNVNKNYYDAEVQSLDFSNSQSVDVINNWVADKTNDKIDKIIDQLNPLDKMVLLNAVYFNGIWSNQFDEEGTKMKMFHQGDNNSYEVAMMSKEDELDYFSNSLVSSVKMPYGNGQYNMVVLLPGSGNNSQDIIDELSAQNWKSWMSDYEVEDKVVVTMPRFKFAFELEMKQVLKEMGMLKAFNPGQSDFSKIADVDDLHINSVVHKSFIDVNESGTEAAAVTSVTFGVTSIQPGADEKIYFTVDKPFVFAITEKDTDAILFIGEVNQPEYD